ncbi:uroporphyrinogen-III synthase [Pseudomonas sp. CCC3.2]|uniref:uroporphyrinogen-III synthase n=1 Tax=unclassified Pseudomonas TaxID=196821 RepID=UPI002AB59178|nr:MULTISPECIES: uroporphyrinogen-III synthase [unclassified Pseudomonas]MDY7562764.1 uroporphyrinogen-III synthase [Pseudomonas sp. AB6]MEA9977372.1 uroporphyrinogen-III synthase [Pseudomonas sp. RTS4]MEB0181392.1 uroporphyrinogen-III synthase [Pseudomonas sp. CCC3.2]MEB0197064.1 uroporphyrinogen-III synthase [Pseudomonas sp. 5S4]MEB0212283.1 uroporphyrinogen-III synthase [Pseudomonas sp. AB6]
MTAWRLLLTRPAQESAALATLLGDVGVYSSSLPLLDIEPLPITGAQRSMIFDLDLYSVVIVVSKPAARLALLLIDEIWPQPPIQRWFTVGAATAQILEEYGLDVAYPQGGEDSEALLELAPLKETLASPGARVLILRGEGGRELLAERLRGLGASVDYLPLYRRTLPSYAASELPRRIEAERLNGVVVSSGQGFEHLRILAGDAWPDVARLPLFVPSPRVAELAYAAGAQTVVDCRGANATALLAALRAQPEPAL